MNAEEMLKRLAKTYGSVEHCRSRTMIRFTASDGLKLIEFGYMLDAAITRGKELEREAERKGRWVDFDPTKVACDMFPIRARVKDEGDDVYVEKTVIGFAYDDGITSFVTSHGHDYDLCQIWEAE